MWLDRFDPSQRLRVLPRLINKDLLVAKVLLFRQFVLLSENLDGFEDFAPDQLRLLLCELIVIATLVWVVRPIVLRLGVWRVFFLTGRLYLIYLIENVVQTPNFLGLVVIFGLVDLRELVVRTAALLLRV